jgi:hypothetical protein
MMHLLRKRVKTGLVMTLLAACLTAGAAAQDSVGDVRVLVVRMTWGPKPDNTAALQQAAPLIERSSFGRLRLQLDITPWLDVYGEATCPVDIEAAGVAARSAGYDPDAYAHVIEVVPSDACGSFVRELGRSFGLSDVPGDPFSPMGKGTLDFSAFEKQQLGWISKVQRVDRSRKYAVADIDLPSTSPQALVVSTRAGEYWIEHRSDKPRRLIVRLLPPKGRRTVFIGAPNDRFVVAKIFSVTRAFRFTWLDRTRPTQPHLHGLDRTVLWWTPSIDRASGVAAYRVALDGKALATTTQTRVTLPELSGTHRLAVVAVDFAGNRSRTGVLLLHIA